MVLIAFAGHAAPAGHCSAYGKATIAARALALATPERDNRVCERRDDGVLIAQSCPYGEAYECVTDLGSCDLEYDLCRGQPCYCPTFNGPVWGIAD